MTDLGKILREETPTLPHTYKILIVDDDNMVAEDVAYILKSSSQRKYATLIASKGSEALQLYQANPDIALVILDTNLLNEKGWQVYDALRAAGYQGSALARSAGGNRPEWTERSVKFLDKAVPSRELEATIDQLLN